MIERVAAVLTGLNIPPEVKARLLADIRQLHDAPGVAAQNTTLYRCAGIIRQSVTPPAAAEWLCQCIYSLTVAVDRDTVRQSIRVNRNRPITLAPDVDPVGIEVQS